MQTIIFKPYLPLLLLTIFLTSFTIDNSATNQSFTHLSNDHDSSKTFKNLLNKTKSAVTIAGQFELNPKVVPFVNEYLSRYSSDLENMKTWGKPYFMLYDKTLADYNLPLELKYLSVIESDLQP